MGYGIFNLASIVLGAVAWLLPITAIILNKRLQQKNILGFTIISASFCALAIYFQTIYTAYLEK